MCTKITVYDFESQTWFEIESQFFVTFLIFPFSAYHIICAENHECHFDILVLSQIFSTI